MFGEYALYCDDKVVGLICDDQVFIKITVAGKDFMGSNYQEGLPYPDAKPYMLLGGDIIENKDAFAQLVELTAQALPVLKPKRSKS
jgi:TfoX/Sxy family transcriptional regulator of competence genes